MEAGKVILEIKRVKDGTMSLSIKVPEELEKFFKDRAEGQTERSNLWFVDKEKTAGAEYYKLGDWSDVQNALGEMYINTAGGRLVDSNQRYNIAPLRLVGATGSVVVFSDRFNVPNLEIETYLTRLADALKVIWLEFISEVNVKATIVLNV